MTESSDASPPWSARTLPVALAAYGSGAVALGVLGVVAAVDLYGRSGSAAWATAAAVCRVAPFVALSPVAGALASRHSGRTLLTVAAPAQLTAAALLAATVGAAPLVVVGVLVFAAHAAWTVSYPSMASMVPTLVPADRLQQANGWATTVESLAWIAGPGIGGLMLAIVGARGAVAMAAVSAAIAIALWSAVPRPPTAADAVARSTVDAADAGHGADDHPDVVDDQATGLLSVIREAAQRLRTPSLAGAVMLHLMDNAAMGALSVLLVVAAAPLGFDSGGYGALSAALAAGSFLSLAVLRRVGTIDRPIVALAIAVLVSGAPVAGLAIVRAPAPALVLVAVSGVGSMLVEVLAITIVQRAVPTPSLAPVLGVLDSLVIGAILLGSLISAPLVAIVGLERALLIVGAVLPAVAVVAVPTFRWGRGEALTAVSVAELTIALPAMALVRPSVRLEVWAGSIAVHEPTDVGRPPDLEPEAGRAADEAPGGPFESPVQATPPPARRDRSDRPDLRERPDLPSEPVPSPSPPDPVPPFPDPGPPMPTSDVLVDPFDVPETVVPETVVPETVVPEAVVPQAVVPETVVPVEEDVLGLVPLVPLAPASPVGTVDDATVVTPVPVHEPEGIDPPSVLLAIDPSGSESPGVDPLAFETADADASCVASDDDVVFDPPNDPV